MLHDRIGEFAALGTAVCWTITAMAFESAGKRVGSLPVNLIRLLIAFLFFAVYSLIVRGAPIPTDASGATWIWLSLSGLVGFVVGDLLLFQAFVLIGSRIAMLIYSAVPPLTAILGSIVLGERIGTLGIVGMIITVAGIALVVLRGGQSNGSAVGSRASAVRVPAERESEREQTVSPGTGIRFAHPIQGILLALGGALGQAGGLVLSKLGAPVYDPISATQIRGIAGIVGFSVIFLITGRWKRVLAGFRDAPAMARISIGAFFGPFVGVSLGLFAAQRSTTGIASTIMSLVPVLIIAPSVLILKEKVSVREIIGAAVAVGGVSLLFL